MRPAARERQVADRRFHVEPLLWTLVSTGHRRDLLPHQGSRLEHLLTLRNVLLDMLGRALEEGETVYEEQALRVVSWQIEEAAPDPPPWRCCALHQPDPAMKGFYVCERKPHADTLHQYRTHQGLRHWRS